LNHFRENVLDCLNLQGMASETFTRARFALRVEGKLVPLSGLVDHSHSIVAREVTSGKRQASRLSYGEAGMRSALIALGMAVLVNALLAAGSAMPDASYEAEVVGSDAYIFSGPGMNFYPTAMLKAGQIVTISGSATDDWYAINPPTDSFSWIEAARVKENTDGSATVDLDQTSIYVGSSLNDGHHVRQLTLSKGDVIHVIDEQQLNGPSGPARWFKILPVSGEKRYIRATSVRTPQVGGAPELRLTPQGGLGASAPVQAPSNLPIAARVGTRIIPAAEPLQRAATSWSGQTTAVATTAKSVSPVSFKVDATTPFADQVSSLKMQLTQMRSSLPDTWDLDSAKKAIDALAKEAKTDADRAQVQRLSQTEAQMRQLLAKYQSIASRRDVFLQQDKDLANKLQQIRRTSGTLVASYDAQGFLRRSTVSIDNQLTYVIEDAAGQPSHYVNFAPGLAGEGYVGKKVGLNGKVSKRDHVPIPRIIVEQVTALD
jgi:hypothetical protein